MTSRNILEYKGYHTKIEYDAEDHLLIGKIEGITDFVNFECENISDVEKEFHQAVDDYLEFCEEVGKAPEKEYKGSFNIRISPEMHKRLALKAMEDGDTLNAAVEKAISKYIASSEDQTELRQEYKRQMKVPADSLKTESTYQCKDSPNIIDFEYYLNGKKQVR